ncbi:MAG TPA: adenosylcobinamide-phosphate synthase CbiB [Candidatus Tectomicrobia bacterium]|nr:adenosylcobinamide-phosphate synthase CbiB [Candidatus Tectomicrobia bacterium]
MTDPIALTLSAGFLLDLLLGDPPWLPHPVRLIGRLAVWAESRCRQLMSNDYLAGAVFTLGLVIAASGSVWLVLWMMQQVHPVLAGLAMVYFMYAGLAVRDLAGEAKAVWRKLQAEALVGARQQLSRIVGRDTEELEAPEIVRATVETVAESTVDGILAPMLFATLGGAPALWAYKAINTLDSMVGHREAPYARFGWAAARLDDAANFVPARLGLLLFSVGAWVAGGEPRRCWHIGRRDGRKHPSPNAGISEAAMAGALGVRLGGRNTYDGIEDVRPYVGDPVRPLEIACIPQTVRIMYATSAAGLAFCIITRWLVN